MVRKLKAHEKIKGWQYKIVDGKRIKPWNYINGGFQIVNKNHKQFYQDIIKYYWENSDKIIETITKVRTATDQTIINFLLNENNIDVKILSDCYNLVDLFRKNLLYVDTGCWWSDELHFLEAGWIYHFNAIPPNPLNRDANYWIERTYKELYG